MPSGEKTLAIYNWPDLYTKFLKLQDEAKDQGQHLSLETFCNDNNLSYTNSSRQFAELARLLTGNKLALLAPKAAKKLGELLDVEDEAIQHKAATAILDRAGHSPAAIQVAIQNNVTNTIALPPIFPANYANELKDMLEGKKDGDA
jgi:hypothetical protein